MLENIPNNSMYCTIPPEIETYVPYEDKVFCQDLNINYEDTIEFLIENNRKFLEDEDRELENLLKQEPMEQLL